MILFIYNMISLRWPCDVDKEVWELELKWKQNKNVGSALAQHLLANRFVSLNLWFIIYREGIRIYD